MSAAPAIGFVSPPGWIDPSPAEFPGVCAEPVRTQQVPLRAPGFDWRIDSVGAMEAEVAVAASTLSAMGCAVTAVTGVPFAWVGTEGLAGARARTARIADMAGIGVVMSSLAILDWAEFVAAAGYDATAATLAELGVWQQHAEADRAYWYPTAEEVAENVRRLVEAAPDTEAVAIVGAGARTLPVIAQLEDELDRPVMGADTALYRAAARAAGVTIRGGAIGRIGEV